VTYANKSISLLVTVCGAGMVHMLQWLA